MFDIFMDAECVDVDGKTTEEDEEVKGYVG